MLPFPCGLSLNQQHLAVTSGCNLTQRPVAPRLFAGPGPLALPCHMPLQQSRLAVCLGDSTQRPVALRLCAGPGLLWRLLPGVALLPRRHGRRAGVEQGAER